MKTRVAIEGLKFFAYHGFYDEERKKGNEFVCDVSVELKSFDSMDDNIYDTVNYEDIYKIVEEEMNITRKLIETIAYNIIEKIKELENVTGAHVKISKLNPPLQGNVDKATVEMKF
jgi:dihydroneopterin aldolase